MPFMTNSKKQTPGDVAQFESALGELEKIVGALERGDLKLEESLKLFERGMALTRQCRQSLDTAELKVKQLLDAAPGASAGDLPAITPAAKPEDLLP